MKFRVFAVLGFKSFENAKTVLAGIELNTETEEGAVRSSVQLRCVYSRHLAERTRRMSKTKLQQNRLRVLIEALSFETFRTRGVCIFRFF